MLEIQVQEKQLKKEKMEAAEDTEIVEGLDRMD